MQLRFSSQMTDRDHFQGSCEVEDYRNAGDFQYVHVLQCMCNIMSIRGNTTCCAVAQFFSDDGMGPFPGLCEVEDFRYSRDFHYLHVLQCMCNTMSVTEGNTACCVVAQFFSDDEIGSFPGSCEVEDSRDSGDFHYFIFCNACAILCQSPGGILHVA